MNVWKVHLAWALATPILAVGWERIISARNEATLRDRERSVEILEEKAEAMPHGMKKAAPPSAPGEGALIRPEPATEEMLESFADEAEFSAWVRRLFRSDLKKDWWEAARYLHRLPDSPLRRELLFEELVCKDPNLRWSAMGTLGEVLGSEATPLLLKVLKSDSEASVRRVAAEYLGRRDGPGVQEALLQACYDPELCVQVTAAASLYRLGQPGPSEDLLPRLADLLENPDGALRRDSASYLAQLKSPSTIPLMTRALHDSNGDVRTEAARGIADLDTPGLLPMLEALCKDPDPKVAEAAEFAITRYQRNHPKK